MSMSVVFKLSTSLKMVWDLFENHIKMRSIIVCSFNSGRATESDDKQTFYMYQFEWLLSISQKMYESRKLLQIDKQIYKLLM